MNTSADFYRAVADIYVKIHPSLEIGYVVGQACRHLFQNSAYLPSWSKRPLPHLHTTKHQSIDALPNFHTYIYTRLWLSIQIYIFKIYYLDITSTSIGYRGVLPQGRKYIRAVP